MHNPASSIYQYAPLRSSNHGNLETFRLVELLPGGANDPLRCRLREVAIGTHQPYEAISYCWGDSHDRSEIDCNGKSLPIPRSLASALQGLRLENESRHLWADAICIDQSSALDKALQVPHMRAIYSRSRGTLVWLGTTADSGIPPLSRTAQAVTKFAIPILGLFGRRVTPTVTATNTRTGEAILLRVMSGRFYLAAVYLLRCPWFRRAWVVQEAAVSTTVTLLFDGIEYAWDDVTTALRFLSGVKIPLPFLPSPQHLAAMDRERALYRAGASSLPGVLIRHRRCLATEPRDKVFAFSGLIDPDEAAKNVRVTYESRDTPATVFRELAVNIIARDRSLDVLSGLPTAKTSRIAAGLPSWVPDWSAEPDLDLGYTWSSGPATLAGCEDRTDANHQSRFRASRGSRYLPRIDGNVLTVNCQLLGNVAYAGPMFSGVKLPGEVSHFRDLRRGWRHTLHSVLDARDVLVQWWNANSGNGTNGEKYSPTGEDMADAFWETICAGEYRASPNLQSSVQVWEGLMRRSSVPLRGVLHSFGVLSALHSTMLFMAVLLKNNPVVEHRLQGRYVMNRKMVRLDSGHLGLANCAAEEGDGIFLVEGSNVPFILRMSKTGDTWTFVGDAYVHGVMDGECWGGKTQSMGIV